MTFFVTISTIQFLIFIILLIKRRRQVGRRWKDSYEAKLSLVGKDLCCSHCGYDWFFKREGQIKTALMSFFNFSIFNQSARCFVCVKCGLMKWVVGVSESVTSSFMHGDQMDQASKDSE